MTPRFENKAFMPQSKRGIEIPALGHDWGEWKVTKSATESAEGLEQRTCAHCGETETRAIPVTVAYRYVGADGASWTRGSSEALSFTFKRSIEDETTFSHFTGIQVDGTAVPEKNAAGAANYTAVSGSVVVALQPSFLETLSVGDHKVEALFDDGSASAAFTVKAAATPNADDAGKTASPKAAGTASNLAKTGDAIPIAAVVAVAGLAIVVALVARRRRTR